MRIGIFGSGHMGTTLARLWLDAGHEVRFGARDPAASAKKGLDPRAHVGTLEAVASWGEAFLLAVPLHATPAIGAAVRAGIAGKPVLDAGNAIPNRDGKEGAEAARIGSGPWVKQHLPSARVVKAFSTVYFQTLAHPRTPPVAVPLVGDDDAALLVAERLVRDAHLEPVLVGRLDQSKRIDFGTPVWNSNMTAPELRRALGLRE